MSTRRYPNEPYPQQGQGLSEPSIHEALKNPIAPLFFPPKSIPTAKLKEDFADGVIPRSAVADIPVATSIPTSPADGDEFYYVANGTAGVVWSFRYRAASSSSYKWELVGGSFLVARTNTLETETTTASYGDLSGGATGPSIVLPLAGDYEIQFGCACVNNTAGQSSIMAPQSTTTAAVDDNAILHTSGAANAFGNPARTDITFTGQSASETLIAKYKVTGGTGSYLRRWIKCRPIRVG